MSALYLTEADVETVLDMPLALRAVEQSLLELAQVEQEPVVPRPGRAVNQPRRRVMVPGCTLHSLSAGLLATGYVGIKSYTTTRLGARFLVQLWSIATGEPVAILEANRLGQVRTGAATGIAAKYMARPEAHTVSCFGCGWQAQAQIQAVCAVRDIQQVAVYSRNSARREQFAAELMNQCGVPVRGVNSPSEAVCGSDIVITATSSATPVFDGVELRAGTFVAAVGSNYLHKTELDTHVIERAGTIVCDSIEACRLEAGDFVPALAAGLFDWSRAVELGDVVTGRTAGRNSPEEITLFKSVGLALEDVAVAAAVLDRAREQGLGCPLPF